MAPFYLDYFKLFGANIPLAELPNSRTRVESRGETAKVFHCLILTHLEKVIRARDRRFSLSEEGGRRRRPLRDLEAFAKPLTTTSKIGADSGQAITTGNQWLFASRLI